MTNIEQYPGYFITEDGIVFSSKKGGIKKLRQHPNHKGYLRVRLNSITVCVHRLVATTFIKNPNQLPQVNHKDGVKANNNKNNLEWCDNTYNQRHAVAMGLSRHLRGQDHGNAKLNEAQVKMIRLDTISTLVSLAKKYGVGKSTIGYIRNNQIWTHI